MNEKSRLYNCKDEELPMVGTLVCSSLETDLPDFTKYSSGFDANYVAGMKQKITLVNELIAPEEETVVRKVITSRIYATMSNLTDPVNRLEGYVTLAHDALQMSPADFGISKLRQGIKSRDVGDVLDALHLISDHIIRYKEPLVQKGLTEEIIASFINSSTSLSSDKTEQYRILNNRKAIVQNNIATLNNLYEHITEVMKIGKILFKNDAVKMQQYTFSTVLKSVHHNTKGNSNNDNQSTDNANKQA